MDLYPRLKINDYKIKEYKEVLTLLPKIVINQDNILIDGMHRLYAFKEMGQKEIDVEIEKTKDDDDILLRAIELNASHGMILTQSEKKKKVIELYKKILDKKAQSYNNERLQKVFSIEYATFRNWIKDLDEEVEAQRNELILKLFLQCKTQEEIAKEVGLTQQTVGLKIKELLSIIDEPLKSLIFSEKTLVLKENKEFKFPLKYGFLGEKIEILKAFQPQLYNIWNQGKISNEIEHFGNVPIEFTENLLYYYTEPFDIVYDPFAGGGPTIDACEKWVRKYYCSDRIPKEIRPEIKRWEIKNGLPKELPNNIKLVFLDPPYWNQAKEKYSKDNNDLANMSLDNFYETLTTFVKECKKKLADNGKIALIIGASQWPNKDYERVDLVINLIERFKKIGFEIEQRIICPYSTEQYNGNQVKIAKEKKICLNIYRDLVVFKKR